jgi:3',5'-cyclic AMP phosphodiesterase CpdA
MSKSKIAVVVCICAIAGVGATMAQAAPGDTLGVSTLVQRILPAGSDGYSTLVTGAGEDYVVRDGSEEGGDALGTAGADRATKRTSLAYFGQLTDFQLADEESPARVEFLDPIGGAFTASWRPSESLNPQEENSMIEQMNAFAQNAPVAAGDGSKPAMDFVMNTGDIADSQQYNEVLWNRQLLEGSMVNPGSGIDPTSSIGTNPLCPEGLTIADAATPTNYTGVQDRSDWPNGQEWYFYDPNEPNPAPVDPTKVNPYADAPTYPGLMNQAQKPFQATGLDVPGYVLFGNHDGLVQGNAAASKLFNQFAQGCLKPVNDKSPENSSFNSTGLLGLVTDPDLTIPEFLQLYNDNPDQFIAVPPDPDRRLISKKEYMDVWKSGSDPTGHGFGFVDPAEKAASDGSAGYYSFSPQPGVRYITLDTHSEGGKILFSSDGNLDTPQFDWFESELNKATENNEIVVVFSHHAIDNLTSDIADEAAPSCASVDPVEVVGCDADPRESTPIKMSEDVTALMHKYPVAVAWVAGHSHVNQIAPYRDPAGNGGFWSIKTSALADWPKQNRLIEIFDNKDGNLSIFGTLIDHAAPVPAPADGTAASSMSTDQLASLGRTIGYNDSQNGGAACGDDPCGEGAATDRNVELLIKDPRRPVVPPVKKPNISKVVISPKKKTLKAGKKTTFIVKVTNKGTAAKKNAKLSLKSSNKQVKVRKSIKIKSIGAKKTVKIKITVNAKSKAKGKAKITANVAGKKGFANVKIKAKKKIKKR